ncbi:MAG: hypothetical protein HY785_21960 [Oscillatoriophycideae cyanobacterium NC_groundwater_1537_Pr4_S-0.65um_50_18]|nr:hypothetical protein [Oscillatoriophycideae cyanobacterium NC_groundwater_1537_Pr4_S-0.65um_50_18]
MLAASPFSFLGLFLGILSGCLEPLTRWVSKRKTGAIASPDAPTPRFTGASRR